MQAISPSQLIEDLSWRYATKFFDPEQTIPAETWQALEEALVLSPSSYGLQPWKFIVITDLELRQQLRPHSWNQPQITDCSHLVVFCSRREITPTDLDRLIDQTAIARGTAPEQLDGYRQMMQRDLVDGPRSQQIDQWSTNQAYIALGNFMTSAALLGVDTCPIEGFEPPAYDRILGLEQSDYRSAVVCAAGYRAEGDKYATLAKVRYPLSEVIEHR